MKYLSFITTLFISALGAAAQPSASTPGKQPFDSQALVDVYNTGDSIAYQHYFEAIMPDAANAKVNTKRMLSEFSFTGKVKLKQTRPLSATETELVLQTDDYHSWWNVLWVTDAGHNFKEHHMRPVRLSSDFLGTTQLSQQQILAGVDDYIKLLTDKKVFAGNVFIAQGGKVLYSKSFGNNAQDQPNTIHQQFDLASMGKLFTTISILQLAEKHKLLLTDSIGKLMPELRNQALAPITIKQLLTHTSGMGDFFEDPAYEPQPGKIIEQNNYLTAIEKDRLHFAPGTGFRYSNTGFLLLGLIVERVSGMPFEKYVTQHIFIKASMTHSKVGSPAGGGMCTVNDLYKFSKAITGSKLLSAVTNRLFISYHSQNWGLGQEYQELGTEIITGHSGGFINVCTELNMYQHSGYTVIILSNSEPPYGHFLSDRIKELIITKS